MTNNLANYFNQRSNTYDQSEFHRKFADLFVEYSQIKSDQKVLEIATGTGLVALEVAKIVGDRGEVIGVDISAGMLNQARAKINNLGLKNLKLILGDGEKIDFPENSFDRILCCSSLHYLTNINQALKHWFKLLNYNGLISVSGFSSKAFNLEMIMRNILQEYNLSLSYFNEVTANPEKCYQLLENAGFQEIKIKTEQLGSYMSLAESEKMWDLMSNNPLNQDFKKLSLTEEQNARKKYNQEIKKLLTPEGIWNDTTTFFLLGRKI